MVRSFIILLLGMSFLLSASPNVLFQPPEEPKAEEILASFQNREGTYGLDRRQFLYRHGSVILSVFYETLPESFTPEERALYSPAKQGDKTIFVYCFGDIAPTTVEPPQEAPEEDFLGTPEPITLDDLAQSINQKNVLLFTGAGISAAAGIHTIATLHQELGLDSSLEVDDFVYNAMHNPEKLVKKILEFYRTAKRYSPTPAHHALASLAKAKKCQILTGNFDLLHERSGVIPLRVFDEEVQQELTKENLKDVEMLIYIGVSRDICNVARLYKEANPEGVIVAINQEMPTFLGENDRILLGDIQELIPKLAP